MFKARDLFPTLFLPLLCRMIVLLLSWYVDKLMMSMNELHKFMAIDAPMRDSESRMRSGFPGNQHFVNFWS